MRLAERSFAASTAIATVLLTAQNYAIQYVDELRRFIGAQQLNILLAAGAFVLLYKGIVYVYQAWGWRLFYRNYLIAGRWKLRLVRSDDPSDTRSGEFDVDQSLFGIRFSGRNTGGKKVSASTWESKSVVHDGNSPDVLWVVYEIRRSSRSSDHNESNIDNGLLRLRLLYDEAHRQVTRIEGEFLDAGESRRRGQFLAARL